MVLFDGFDIRSSNMLHIARKSTNDRSTIRPEDVTKRNDDKKRVGGEKYNRMNEIDGEESMNRVERVKRSGESRTEGN
jgi:hypothetical protein